MDANNSGRFDLINAAHRFLLDVVPLRKPESLQSLDRFVSVVARSAVPRVEVDSVLIRCLKMIDSYTGARLPTLVDQYVLGTSLARTAIGDFAQCVESAIRYAGIHDGNAQEVVRLVETQYADSALTSNVIARTLKIRLSTLCTTFKRSTGRTLSGYIRTFRLERAAVLLATSNCSVKEVWSSVGYNHGSNFGHDFKKRFGCAPLAYRTHIVRPIAQEYLRQSEEAARATREARAIPKAIVLIVDDAEITPLALGTQLRRHEYTALTASTGGEGIRLAQSNRPHVILLDYHLGDMDGCEFIRRLRALPHGQEPSVAIFTADCDIVCTGRLEDPEVTVVSKLCDLASIKAVVDRLSATSTGRAAAVEESVREPVPMARRRA